MPIQFESLYNQVHQFNQGVVNINTPFTGNVLSLNVSTKPEYLVSSQVIGYLYQYYGENGKGYAIKSGVDLIALELPETDSLKFVPTAFLSDSYTLKISYTSVGQILNESNTVPIPSQILALPNQFSLLENDLSELELAVQGLEAPTVNWDSIQNKPLSFNPSTHSHSITEITGLSTELTIITDRLDDIEALPQAGSEALSFLTQNSVLADGSYLSLVPNLVCTLPSQPDTGDRIALTAGNHNLQVRHGNGTNQIRNGANLTMLGADEGIILRPYSRIELIYLDDKWISFERVGTVDNFMSIYQVPYTVATDSFVDPFGTPLNNIFNGVKVPTGAFTTDGVMARQNILNLTLSFASPIIPRQLRLWGGQGNDSFGGAAQYGLSGITVYAGTSSSGQLLGTFTFSNLNGIEQVRDIVTNTSVSSLFLVCTGNANNIGILELEVYAKTV
ncbi:MAG: hypothetical protein DCE90_14020 [Pseudanabaena sp.]|nr:MAG: hypothetical protein DCE90_14020 [Pseudanabaena sp.]